LNRAKVNAPVVPKITGIGDFHHPDLFIHLNLVVFNMRWYYWMIGFIFLHTNVMFGQGSVSSVFRNLSFNNHTMNDGLPANYCYDVIQDKKGYIWVATLNGMARFNGKQWITFQQQSEKKNHTLPSNWVTDIDCDVTGNIWANTVAGIACYNGQKDTTYTYIIPNYGWGKIVCTPANQIFTSSWQGIQQFESALGEPVLKKKYSEASGNSINKLFTDSLGNVWACPEDHPSLIKINPKNQECTYITQIKYNQVPTEMIIQSMSNYRGDTLLLCTRKLGLLKYHPPSNTAIPMMIDGVANPLNITCATVYEYQGETMLVIGTKTQGLYLHFIQSGISYHYRHDNYNPSSIASDYVLSVYPDRDEGVWVCTSKGLSYFHPLLQQNKYYHFYANNYQSNVFLINCVEQLSYDEFLIGTEEQGLFYYHAQLNTLLNVSFHSELAKQVTSFYRLNPSQILVSTNAGIYGYAPATKKCSPYIIPGLPATASVLKIKRLGVETLGVCTNEGLIVYDMKAWRIIYNELNNGIPQNEKITKDVFIHGSDLWILRFFSGLELYSFNSQQLVSKTPRSLFNKPVDFHNLTYDQKGHLFISSSCGLIVQNIFTKKEANVYYTANGLAGDIVENVLYANQGLYYTTREALYQIDLNTFISTKIHQYDNYSQKWHNQLDLLPNGNVVYSISDYFIIYEPLPSTEQHIPLCETEEISIHGQSIHPVKDTLYLGHQENNISIQLAGLVYPHAERTSWVYYLDHEKNTHVTHDGRIELNYLAPGDYQLVIASQNYQGYQSSEKKIIFLHISAPYYKTWWFYVLIVLGILGLLAIFMEYRRRQQKRMVDIRNQISRDLHDELGANVSSINIMSNMLLKDKNEKNRLVIENISKYSIQISDTINDIIWNINPRFDNLDELIKKMTRYASETLDAAEITYRFSSPNPLPQVSIQNKYKYHIYLIFKEAINNAAKYSNAKNIHITLEYTDKKFGFKVIDDGIGFDETAENNGNGLRNMAVRARELKALLQIESALNQGTQITFQAKIS
jgi:ligand-binding sensor domain-containing protein